MKKEKIFKKMVFKDYYDTLSDADKETVRSLILAESGMSYTTFYYKLRNDSFKPLEMRLIDKIISKMPTENSLTLPADLSKFNQILIK